MIVADFLIDHMNFLFDITNLYLCICYMIALHVQRGTAYLSLLCFSLSLSISSISHVAIVFMHIILNIVNVIVVVVVFIIMFKLSV